MTRIFSATALVSTLAFVVPAHADVTADEVWQALRSGALSGLMENATVSRSGSSLTISNLTVMGEVDTDEEFEASFGDITLTEIAGGRVEIDFGDAYPVSVSGGEGADAGSLTVLVRNEGLSIIASGSPDAMNYDFAANSISVDMADLEITPADEDIPLEGGVTIDNVAGGYKISTERDIASVASAFTFDAMRYDLSGDDLDGASINFNLEINGLSTTSNSRVPLGIDLFDPMAMANPDYSGEAQMSYTGGSLLLDLVEDTGTNNIVAALSGGSSDVSFGDGQVSYVTTGGPIEVEAAVPDLPFPVSFSLQGTGMRVAMPLIETQSQRDIAFGLTLEGVEVNNGIWNLFDPGAILPRDPATISFDINGQGRWFLNIMDPEDQMKLEMGETPGELTAVSVNDLRVSMVGAELTGQGDFQLNNNDLTTFDGLPAPSGVADFSLVGANGLMDKLTQMGLLPQEQAMGARMMMGLFAVPGDGPDSLNSRIEVTEDGQVLANGQRLR